MTIQLQMELVLEIIFILKILLKRILRVLSTFSLNKKKTKKKNLILVFLKFSISVLELENRFKKWLPWCKILLVKKFKLRCEKEEMEMLQFLLQIQPKQNSSCLERLSVQLCRRFKTLEIIIANNNYWISHILRDFLKKRNIWMIFLTWIFRVDL